jgi:hypothetical protein
MRRLGVAMPSGAAFGIALRGLGSSADRFGAERKAAEYATLIQVSHVRVSPRAAGGLRRVKDS